MAKKRLGRALLAPLPIRLRQQAGPGRSFRFRAPKRKERLAYWELLSGKSNLGVSDQANGAEVCLYVISCRLERVKIGVASDAEKRLRELQVGSPVELKLTLTRPYGERRDADAVADELYRYFAG